jgi:hypothetical protein
VVNHQHPLADLLGVPGVMGGEEDGDALEGVEAGNQLANAGTGHHVQTDGGFIPEEELGLVN